MDIRLTNFRLEERDSDVRAACSVGGTDLPDTLWFEVPERSRDALDVAEPNWAAVALLYPAMALGQGLVVDAPLSPRLLHGLGRDVQTLLASYDPGLRRIDIRAAEAGRRAGPAPEGVATGFSAGIDSFATLILETADDIPAACRLTDLAVFNVGAFDNTTGTDRLFRLSAERCAAYAARRGFGTFFVNSNLDDFFAGLGPGRPFQSNHTLRDVAAALLLQNAVGRYLYSSGVPYDEVTTRPSPAISHLDPILLPLLSTERLSLLSGVPGMSRTEKTALVAEDLDAQAMLDVCITNPERRLTFERPNCSRCWKCTRTILTLEALGKLDAFEQVFDLRYYRTHRTHLLYRLMLRANKGDAPSQGALAFARARGVKLPGRLHGVRQQAARLGRRARRASGLLGSNR
jgi:hypothetical protein